LDPESAAAKPYLNRSTVKTSTKSTSHQHPAYTSPSNSKDGIAKKDDANQVGHLDSENMAELNIGGLTLISNIEVSPVSTTTNNKRNSSPE
jgi:hypothetical protein